MKGKKQRVSWSLILTMVLCLCAVFPQRAAAVTYQTLGSMAVGSTVKLNVGGVATDFLIVQQGSPSSAYGDASNGTWLLGKTAATSMNWGGDSKFDYTYATTNIHTYLNSFFFESLDESVQQFVRQATIPTFGCSGLQAKVFSLSGTELGQSNWYTSVEGTTLSYFAGGAHINMFTSVWTRTRESSDNRYAWSVVCYDNDENWDETTYVYSRNPIGTKNRVLPAMILEPSLLVGSDNTVITDANYTTNYYQQNVTGDGYTLVEAPTARGTINSAVTAEEKSYTGFHENAAHPSRVPSGTIANDGSTILSRYYDRNTFTAAFDSNGGSAVGSASGIRYGAAVSAPTAPTKKGYDFGLWYTDAELRAAYDFITPVTTNITLYAGWTPRNDTPYIVEHYQEDLIGGYTLEETEHLTGTTDDTATAGGKTYTGFHLNPSSLLAVPSASISPEGTTALKLYYDRNVNTVTYAYDGDTDVTPPELPAPAAYRYGQTVSIVTAPALAGYDFGGWTTSDAAIVNDSFTMPDAAVSITGAWTARTDTPYTVEYYQQNAEDDGYTLTDTEHCTGTTGGVAMVPDKSYPGFSVTPESTSAATNVLIKSNGSTLLKLYYNRNVETVTYTYSGDTDVTPPALPVATSYRFGQTVSVAAAPSLAGYDFGGWETSDASIVGGSFTMLDAPVNITGAWIAKADTPYVVEYYQQNIQEDGYTLADTFAGEGTAGGNIPLKEFEGFLLTPDSVTAAGSFKIRSDGTATLKLYYDRERFTVTYAYAGRSAGDTVPEDAPGLPATVSYRYGQTVILPAQPQSKSAQRFLGWALDGTLTNALNFALEKDVVVTGYWYTPTYSDGGGDNDKAAYSAVLIPDSAATDIVLQGDTNNRVTFLKPPEKKGCTFAGWATESGGDAAYHAGDTITLTSNCVFYAVYYRQIEPYIIGFTDNTFRPCSNLTLKQGALMLNRLGISTQITSQNLYFTRRVFLSLICTATGADIRSQDPMTLAVEKGWIAGFTDGTLRPDDYITRAQTATILDRVFRQGDAQVKDGKFFADIPQTHWANDAISRASATSTIRV